MFEATAPRTKQPAGECPQTIARNCCDLSRDVKYHDDDDQKRALSVPNVDDDASAELLSRNTLRTGADEISSRRPLSVFGAQTVDAASAAEETGNLTDCSNISPVKPKRPKNFFAQFLTGYLVAVFTWCLLFGIVKSDALPPDGKFFALWLIVVGGLAAGWLVEQIHLPALLGMLLWGFALRNVPGVNVAASLDTAGAGGGRVWASQLRSIALAIILLRAGLGLDMQALKRLKWVIVSMAVLPPGSVVIVMLLLGHFLLLLPYVWSLLLGWVACAVSPAVIVPLMLLLQEERCGTQKGIPSAAIAATTLAGVLAVCGFGLVLGMIFATGSLTMSILRAPIEIALGVLYGATVGVVLWYIPSARSASAPYVGLCRFVLLTCSGVGAVCCTKVLGITGAGILGCLLSALVAAIGWTKQQQAEQNRLKTTYYVAHDCIGPVAAALKFLWLYMFQPLLFGLIGAAVSVQQLKLQTVVYALAIVLVAHLVQFFVTVGVVSWRRFGFSLRERIFFGLTALPKATFQAAIGSVALDTVRERYALTSGNRIGTNMDQPQAVMEQYGQDILTVAVLCIILTAPLGAIAITLGSKRLLQKEVETTSPNVEAKLGG